MSDAELTRQLNSTEDSSRMYQTIQDNQTSRIQVRCGGPPATRSTRPGLESRPVAGPLHRVV